MKFFHVSDLHIGKMLHGYDLLSEQVFILEQIAKEIDREKPEGLLVAGDIYDKSIPSAQAVTVFDDFLTRVIKSNPDMHIFIISGNHDSARRLDYASRLLEKFQIHIASVVSCEKAEDIMKKIAISDEYGDVNVYLLPFIKPTYVRVFFDEGEITSYEDAVRKTIEAVQINKKERNVLVAHQFFTAAGCEVERSDSETVHVGGLNNVDISCVKDFDYVALGHIHKRQEVALPHIRYCGTPLKYSVSEEKQEKSISVIEMGEKGDVKIREITLLPKNDLKTIEGKLSELISNEKVETVGKDTYLSVTVTDETEPFDAKRQLDRVYNHVLEWKVKNVENKTEYTDMELSVEEMSEEEIFETFFEQMNGVKISEEQKKLLNEILEKEGMN